KTFEHRGIDAPKAIVWHTNIMNTINAISSSTSSTTSKRSMAQRGIGNTLENHPALGLFQVENPANRKRLAMGTRDVVVKTHVEGHAGSRTVTKDPQDRVMIDLTGDDETLSHTTLRCRNTRGGIDASFPTTIIVGGPDMSILPITVQKANFDIGLGQFQNHQNTYTEVLAHRTSPLRTGDLRKLDDIHLHDMLMRAGAPEDSDNGEPATENKYGSRRSPKLDHSGNVLDFQTTVAQRVTQDPPGTGLKQKLSRHSASINSMLEPVKSLGGPIDQRRSQSMGGAAEQDRKIMDPKRLRITNEEEDHNDGIVVEYTAMRVKAEEKRKKRDDNRPKSKEKRNAARLSSDKAFNEQRGVRLAGSPPTSRLDKVVNLSFETPTEDVLFTEGNPSLRPATESSNYQRRHPDMRHDSELLRPEGHRWNLPSTSVLQALPLSSECIAVKTGIQKLLDTSNTETSAEFCRADVGQAAEGCVPGESLISDVPSKPIHLVNASDPFIQEHFNAAIKSHDGATESPFPPVAPENNNMGINDSSRLEDSFGEDTMSIVTEVFDCPNGGIASATQRSELAPGDCRERMESVAPDFAVAHLIKSLRDIDSQKQPTRIISLEDEKQLIAMNEKTRRDESSVQYRARQSTGAQVKCQKQNLNPSSMGFAAWAKLNDTPSSETVEGTVKPKRKRVRQAEKLRRVDKGRREEEVEGLLGCGPTQVSSVKSSHQSTNSQPSKSKRGLASNSRRNERKPKEYRLAKELTQRNDINNPDSKRTLSFSSAEDHNGQQVDLEDVAISEAAISESERKRIRSEKASFQRKGEEEQKLLAVKSALEQFNPGRQNVGMDSERSAPVNQPKIGPQLAIKHCYESSSSSDEDEDDAQVEKKIVFQQNERPAIVSTATLSDNVATSSFRQTKGGKGLSPAVLAAWEAERSRKEDVAVCSKMDTFPANDDDNESEHSVAEVHFQYIVERVEYFYHENKEDVEGKTYGPFFLLEEANTVAREILTPAQRGLEICPPWYGGTGKDAG
ncbi:MAG: hypothetical protein Q9187_008071, partial [Circinaria calcarea]